MEDNGIRKLLLVVLAGIAAAFVWRVGACGTVWVNGTPAKLDLAITAVEVNGNISKALDAFKNDMGKYPDSDEGLQVLFQKKGQNKDVRFKGPYLNGTFEKNCKDPWGHRFEYKCPGIFNEYGYDLWSRGPDGQNNGGRKGSDDIKNWDEK